MKYKSISAEFVNIGVSNLKIVISHSLCVLKGDVTHKRLKEEYDSNKVSLTRW